MAGHVATKIFFGEYWTGASGDNRHIRANIRALASLGYFGPPVKEMPSDGGSFLMGGNNADVEKFWNIMEEQTERILYQHYWEVEAVAQALLASENLTSTEVLDLLGVNSMGVGNPDVKIQSLLDKPLKTSPNGHEIEGAEDFLKLPEPAQVSEPVAGD